MMKTFVFAFALTLLGGARHGDDDFKRLPVRVTDARLDAGDEPTRELLPERGTGWGSFSDRDLR